MSDNEEVVAKTKRLLAASGRLLRQIQWLLVRRGRHTERKQIRPLPGNRRLASPAVGPRYDLICRATSSETHAKDTAILYRYRGGRNCGHHHNRLRFWRVPEWQNVKTERLGLPTN